MEIKRSHPSDHLPSTIVNSKYLEYDLMLPEHVDGLRILDIGGGLTTVPRELAARNARIVAVDIRYADIQTLINSASEAIEEIDIFLRDTNEIDNNQKKAIVQSFQHMKEKAQNYLYQKPNYLVAADMYQLPFADNTFDFTYSRMCLDRAGTYEDFNEAFDEAYRVTKKGGEIQVAPFDLPKLVQYGSKLEKMYGNTNVLVRWSPNPANETGFITVFKQN